ncbi:hypothetical protein CWI37_0994p0010 [Hamiltosporidium tvaerminnensis]|uniref:Uncharacterized protein n=1 Tax=Hamiltosporidium tvaerminnensis TaxID=1176355 RepID=A0A4V2JUJ2_9MICR|nr:hypothetical protein LUQ84_000285 [Hamiltosporidium tvaerminnensis]TBU00472.1 hypothetical protein CWI37_0994p0010 [Hamiltosporidium tvaerminnensis]
MKEEQIQHIEVNVIIKEIFTDTISISSSDGCYIEQNPNHIFFRSVTIGNLLTKNVDAIYSIETDPEAINVLPETEQLLYEEIDNELKSTTKANRYPKLIFVKKYAMFLYFSVLDFIDTIIIGSYLYKKPAYLFILSCSFYLGILFVSLSVFSQKKIPTIFKYLTAFIYFILISAIISMYLCVTFTNRNPITEGINTRP